ncbi:MAG TPA: FAD-dependent oxidoreductase [Bacteroidota bacterium]|nr:FAD-dependent oxidoreductase [Bacteroidota bacterium]
MKSDSGESISVWAATDEPVPHTQLFGTATTDVCIVGAGLAGLSTAYHLAREGKSVIVIDDGIMGGGESSRTTAHLANALDEQYYQLEKIFGVDGIRLAAESHGAAIDRIEEIIQRESIDCEFKRLDSYLVVPRGASADVLKAELESAHRAGLTGVEYPVRVPYNQYDFGPALRYPNQGQFHVVKFMNGLARAIKRMGGEIYTFTHADLIQGGETAHIETSTGAVVYCRSVVVATNTPVNNRVAIHTKQAPYRSYVIGARIPKGTVPSFLLCDTEDPYHYVRQTPMDTHDVLIVGGEDHKTGQAQDPEIRFNKLETWARERFPMIESIEYRWSGQLMETVDGLAFIGCNPMDKDNVYIATGDSGNGMTHGMIAGMLITDLIMNRTNPWSKLYDPSRISLSAAEEFAKENLNVASKYSEHVKKGDVASVDDVAPGAGAVIRHKLKKHAVYRDEEGFVYSHSAVCPHLKCIVAWNPLEKTWDCPCHGSRFDRLDGHVINGPAVSPLPSVEE